jgi:hypothetical protein
MGFLHLATLNGTTIGTDQFILHQLKVQNVCSRNVQKVFFYYIMHHHQPINVPTAGAQAFLMDYPQGERAITHHAGPVRIGGC